MEPYKFNEQNEIGKIGEGKVIDYFTNVKNRFVEDVREDPHYQKRGIDIIVDGLTKIEVKTDTTNTPNFFFETISSSKYNTVGCFLSTESDWIAYLKQSKLYLIETIYLKGFYHTNQSKLKLVQIVKECADGRGNDIGIGALINISVAEKALYKHIFSVQI